MSLFGRPSPVDVEQEYCHSCFALQCPSLCWWKHTALVQQQSKGWAGDALAAKTQLALARTGVSMGVCASSAVRDVLSAGDAPRPVAKPATSAPAEAPAVRLARFHNATALLCEE